MTYTVAVRALCEFTARSGDLDLRYNPAPTAQEGMAGHALVASRRPPGYQTEVALSGNYGILRVRGRADGYDPNLHRLEEIKTHRGDPARVPDNTRALHMAQARVYGHLMCERLGCEAIEVAVVYLDIASGAETTARESRTAADLKRFFEDLCACFLAWAEQESAHRNARDAALRTMEFPYPALRGGQRDLAKAVYRAARDGGPLMAQAPTGIGKTLGTLFPVLKACPGTLDKVFFLCAKTAGRRLALDALRQLAPDNGAVPVRSVELAAREHSCVHPGKACHGGSCPLARGFYDRLPAARQSALRRRMLDRAALDKVAAAHAVCPYFLGTEVARWADVVVGDYNYYFDGSAMLHAQTLSNQWRVALLADEAHNLVERARAMYSTALDRNVIREAARLAPPAARSALLRLDRRWRAAEKSQPAAYAEYEALPDGLLRAMQEAAAMLGEHFAQAALQSPTAGTAPGQAELAVTVAPQVAGTAAAANGAALAPAHADTLLTCYFDLLRFVRLAENLGPHTLIDMERIALAPAVPAHVTAHVTAHATPRTTPETTRQTTPQNTPQNTALPRPRRASSILSLRNIVPAHYLSPRFSAARTAILFSATLGPAHFYRNMLGLPDTTPWLDVAAPFPPEHLAVHLVGNVSTRFHDRQASLAPVADLIATAWTSRPGNYLCFASSFDYLAAIAQTLATRHPQVPQWRQTAAMDEAARAAFIGRFVPGGQGVGFAVLGGVFGEGVDLPGSRLIGAFILTLGLPQTNRVNETMRARMQARFGSGYDYTYLYPGLQKVVQAAGRVLRSETDEGVIYLIDDRFKRREVRQLLPSWWRVRPVSINRTGGMAVAPRPAALCKDAGDVNFCGVPHDSSQRPHGRTPDCRSFPESLVAARIYRRGYP